MKIIIVGGGTGGHLFPGIAIAREFQKRNPKIKILFVGTRRGIEYKVLPKENFELKTILSSGLKGKISWRTLIALVEIPIAFLQSLWVLINFRPKLVLGVGGYVTGPFVLMAWLLRIPTAIQEQNSMPGMTNRILGRIVDKIFVTFEKSKKHFPEKKIEVTGNPIREEYYEAKVRRKESQFNVLIFGGSKGASSINRAMVEALDFLSEDKNSLHFIHQTGEEQFKTVKKSYRSKNVSADVSKFIFNMADDYRRSNLVICRAGASTLAEIAACGRAAILVPYPFAANNHQQLNAEYLVEQGAALMVKDCDLSGKKIAELIKKMMHQPNLLQEIEKVSAAMAKKDAGKKVVDLCYELIA
ncbi:MAG TPA: undecaprenyldiphospho-muramoylpentapeptide beta-N-acetylglucosaminyltransferase [Nitrospinota bacterium]|nr:undecaprenyldiphospho-muramoylpentapeptide beta-N-acetylglucosaminyltransferase [Nitrospinota bacterium]